MRHYAVFSRAFLIIAVAAAFLLNCGKSTEPRPDNFVNRVSMPDDLAATGGDHFTIPVTIENDLPISGVSVPLVYSKLYGRCDSVSYVDSRLSGFLFKWGYVDTANGIINLGAVHTGGANPGKGSLALLYFWAYGNAPAGDLIIDANPDSSKGPVFADTSISPTLIRPQFKAGKVHINSLTD